MQRLALTAIAMRNAQHADADGFQSFLDALDKEL